MKVLVSFKPKSKYDNFEGTRLRKTIKGALEISDISYAVSEDEYFDVAHFISPDDELKITLLKDKGIPVVLSALYTENDPTCAYLEYRKKDKKMVIRAKAMRVLNKADLVLVPTLAAKEFLISNGVSSLVEVVEPGTNLSRFNILREDEKEIFYRYFGEVKERKVVISIGSYDNVDGINAFIKAAERNPSVSFYYFAQDNPKNSWKIRFRLRKAPKNIRFETIPPDDVYRSALINADVVTYIGYDLMGVTSLLDAMASHSEIVVRKQPLLEGILTDEVNCHLGQYSETIADIIADVINNNIASTSEGAFLKASTMGLDVLGAKLKDIYQKLVMKDFLEEENSND